MFHRHRFRPHKALDDETNHQLLIELCHCGKIRGRRVQVWIQPVWSVGALSNVGSVAHIGRLVPTLAGRNSAVSEKPVCEKERALHWIGTTTAHQGDPSFCGVAIIEA
jgi:hypothetical protein